MGRNSTSISAERTCPSCNEPTLEINLEPVLVNETNRIKHRYKFECTNWRDCVYESKTYEGPEIDVTNFDSVTDAREKSRELAVEAAKNRNFD